MKICFTSDLHHGFDNNTYRIHEKFFAKMAFEDFDVLILAGDLCSHQQRNLESLFAMIRKHLPETCILAVILWAGSLFQWDLLKEENKLPRIYIHGHTHIECDEIIDGVRVLMCGSDYNRPQYKIIEVNKL